MRTEMYVLVLENCLLLKEEQPPWPEEKGHIERYPVSAAGADLKDPAVQPFHDFFDEAFVPVAKTLAQHDAIQVKTAFKKTPSTWTAITADQSPAAVFEFPSAMHEAGVRAETLAEAVVEGWVPGSPNTLILPMLTKLLALKEHWNPDEEAGFEEDVSDMVYVMY